MRSRGVLPMSFLSYHPLWSIHWRSSSIGGWAPYFSNDGMLRSSMKKMAYLPSGGAKTPFRRLSSLPSMRSFSGKRARLNEMGSTHISFDTWTYYIEHAYYYCTWVWLDDVLAENIMKFGMKCWGIPFRSLSPTTTDLPVPVGPTTRTWITKDIIITAMRIYNMYFSTLKFNI